MQASTALAKHIIESLLTDKLEIKPRAWQKQELHHQATPLAHVSLSGVAAGSHLIFQVGLELAIFLLGLQECATPGTQPKMVLNSHSEFLFCSNTS